LEELDVLEDFDDVFPSWLDECLDSLCDSSLALRFATRSTVEDVFVAADICIEAAVVDAFRE
jgi:hypothetical protein